MSAGSASDGGTRPGWGTPSGYSWASIGVTPVHQRCISWVFPASESESANCGMLGIHQAAENFFTRAAAWLSAHCFVAVSPLLAAMSARS